MIEMQEVSGRDSAIGTYRPKDHFGKGKIPADV
jgi:hypothetical protein